MICYFKINLTTVILQLQTLHCVFYSIVSKYQTILEQGTNCRRKGVNKNQRAEVISNLRISCSFSTRLIKQYLLTSHNN